MDLEQKRARAKLHGTAGRESGLAAGTFAHEPAGIFRRIRLLGAQSFSRSRRASLRTLGVLAIGLLAQTARAGFTFTNLVSFTGTNGDSPIGTLVQGRDGDLYGVTQGGTFGPGPVFKMALDGTLTILALFGGTNGSGPHAGLVQGSDGNFYGTTSYGGQYSAQNGLGYGTVYQITPGGLLTTLVLFNGTNGQWPGAELVQGTDGNFYGTTQTGGQYHDSYGNGYGTVFKVTSGGELTSLFSFNATNGAGYSPWCSLSQGSDGNFYGTTRAGGSGQGTLFQMTPAGALTNLLSFNGTNGNGSFFGLVQGADGNLYGTSDGGGSSGCGTVYRVAADGVLTTLASFSGTNGDHVRGMIQAADGNFYGMTASGGIGYSSQVWGSGSGTVFQVTPAGAITSLVLFTNGDVPFGGLIQASDGNLYGMTRQGGAYGHGRIFRLSVPMPPVFRTMTQTGSTVCLTWSAVAGQKYQVQYSTTLAQTNWINLGSPFTATDGTATASDTIGPDAQRLYRVVLLP